VMELRSDMTLVKPSATLRGFDRSGDTGAMRPTRRRQGRRRTTGQEIHEDANPELRLSSGSSFLLELTGDVELVADESADDTESGDQLHTITYHELVGLCCRRFVLVPKSSADADKDTSKVCLRSVYEHTPVSTSVSYKKYIHVQCYR